MNKQIALLLFIVCIFTACKNENKALIEQKWISGLEMDLERKKYKENIILTLEEGQGLFCEFGKGCSAFPYILADDDIQIGQSGEALAKILYASKDSLELDFLEQDTLQFSKIPFPELDFNQTKSLLINKSYELLNHDESYRSIIHFTDREILILSQDVLKDKEEEDFPSLMYRRREYSIDSISGFVTLKAGGFLRLMDYPLVGFVEKNPKGFFVHTYMHDGIRKSQLLRPITAPEKTANHLLEKQWRLGAGKRLETFDFLENQELVHSKNGVKSNWKWSLDESGFLVILEDENGDKKYVVKSFYHNNYRMGYELAPGKFSDLLNIKI